jgi:hypothetical protein
METEMLTADTVIQDMVGRPHPNPSWGPEDTRQSLEGLRAYYGDAWIVANRAALEAQLDDLADL